ncbi:MAG: M56 family metallopeptidase [Pseudomonadota bacterium]
MSMDVTAFWDALGWSILHSLWQGALIGLIVYGLRMLATDRRAWLRYLIGMGGMIATFAAFMVTFVILMTDRVSTIASGRETIIETGGDTAMSLSFTVLPSAAPQSSLAEALVPWLGMVWAIGFACLSLQAYRAWAETRRLATTGLSAPEGNWDDRFVALIERSRSSQRIRMFVSAHVAGPQTLGALKPVVLVPAGFLTSMPPAHVEAILLHELAHIRRHDFLMGLIQTAIRTVLYFNPAVIILSRQIDEDREQACDDMAVAVTGQPADLVRGLAALRLGKHASHNELAMAADGGPLLTRLNRLMGRSVSSRSTSKLSAAAISALLIGTAAYSTVSLASATDLEAPPAPPADKATLELPDTVVKADAPKPAESVIPKGDIHLQLDGKDKLVINTDDGNHQWIKTVDASELPPMPEMPAMPSLPPIPAAPAIPPVPSFPVPIFGDYDSEDDFEGAMEAWGEKMEDWGDRMSDAFDEEWEAKMEAWGAEVEARFEGDWEAKMEAWGEEMEVWGEAVEEIAGEAGEYAISRMAEIDVEAIREQALRAAENGREWTEKQVEKDVLKAMQKYERKQAEKARAEAAKQREKAAEQREKAAKQREQAAEQQRQAAEQRAQAVEQQKQAAEQRRQASEQRRQAVEQRAKAEQDRARAEVQRREAVRYAEARALSSGDKDQSATTLTFNGPMSKDKKLSLNGRTVNIGALHTDLLSAFKSDGLIKRNAKTVDLEITCEEMTVNGNVVPESKAERYRKLLEARGFDLDQKVQMSLKKEQLTIKLSGKA